MPAVSRSLVAVAQQPLWPNRQYLDSSLVRWGSDWSHIFGPLMENEFAQTGSARVLHDRKCVRREIFDE